MNHPGENRIKISQGSLVGRKSKDIKNREYYSFQGIPYAKPPVGNLRFKDPEPPEPWSIDLFDATKEGNTCYGYDIRGGDLRGSEDCLFLNVYTPNLPDKTNNKLLPVMFWIHGGAFSHGSGNSDLYGPEILVAEDIVLVTINYRLGVFGFLSFEDPSLKIPGNAGLKDQVMALRWVKENISAFGGDPNNVTVFGQSAGGASVHFLILSPLAKGLFHRAIIQSGCVLNPWVFCPRRYDRIANYLNCKSNVPSEILQFLKEASTNELFEAQMKIAEFHENEGYKVGEIGPIGPVIENSSDGTALISQDPIEIIRRKEYNVVSMIFGFTSQEGLLMKTLLEPKIVYPNFTDVTKLIPRSMLSDSNEIVGEFIKDHYYKKESPSEETIEKYFRFVTDVMFLHGIHRSVKAHVENSLKPIYYYEFHFDTKLNFTKQHFNLQYPGVAHGDDLGYLFKQNTQTEIFSPDSPETFGRKIIVKYWTTFAKTGEPTPTDDNYCITWLPAEPQNMRCMHFGPHLQMKDFQHESDYEMWEMVRLGQTTTK